MLAGRSTDSQGEFDFDTEDLSGAARLAFAKDTARVRFEPSEIEVGVAQCPGRVCAVTAINDPIGTTTLTWNVRGANGRGVAGIPVHVSDAVSACESRVTDTDGTVVFAVYRTLSACNDNNTTTSDNFTTITTQSPPGTAYTIVDPGSPKFSRCALNAISGFFVASGGPAPTLSVGSPITYKITARAPNGTARAGVTFTGPQLGVLPEVLRTTGAGGSFFVSTTQLGIAPSASWSLAAVGDYDVYPRQMTIDPLTRTSNEFRFTAFSNFRRSGALIVDVRDGANDPVGGISIGSPQLAACGESPTTNGSGRALIGYKVVPQCNNGDNDRRNDTASFVPAMPGCQFTDSYQTPFERCMGENTAVSLRAFCGEPAPAQYLVSGRVFDQEAQPLDGASIIRDGVLAATTGVNGSYSIYVDEFTSPNFRAFSGPLIFDPQTVGIAEIDRSHENVDFRAVGPLSQPGATPPPPACPPASTYTIRGTVTALDGTPLAGATISENNVAQATTDSLGNYSFSVAALDDVWLTVEVAGRRFDPAARYFPDVRCDRVADFHEIIEESYRLVGRVVDAVYQPLAGARVSLVHGGTETIAETDEDGYYLLTVPDEAQYVITATYPGHEFAPALYSGEGERDETGLNFTSTVQPTPTPTATPANPTPPPGGSPPPAPPGATPTPGNPGPPPTSTPGMPPPTPTNNPGAPNPTPPASPTSGPVNPTATPLPPGGSPPPTATPPSAPPPPPVAPTNTPGVSPTVTPPAPPPGATSTPNPPPPAPPGSTPTQPPAGSPTPPPAASPTVPVPTATPITTSTPVPTPTVTVPITVASVCSDDPTVELRWAITNPGPIEVTLTWDIYGTNQNGTIVAPIGTVYLTTQRASGSNTLRLSRNGVMIAVRSAEYAQCPATPTPTPTLSPTETPTAIPTGAPTPPPAPPPPGGGNPPPPPGGGNPPPESPTATPTPTETPTPVEYRVVTGRLTGKDGAGLTASMMAKLERLGLGAIKIVATNRDSNERFEVLLERPFRYSLTLPAGEYRFRLVSSSLTVLSRPTSPVVDLAEVGKTRLNFAIKVK